MKLFAYLWKKILLWSMIMLCSMIFFGWITTANKSFWFGKTDSIKSTKDITIWWLKTGDWTIKREDSLLDIIKWISNWVLWIMALIALIFVIYGWIKMTTASGEEWPFTDWAKIVRRALIWLLYIGITWFIISAIFWLANVWIEPTVWWEGALTDQG